MFPSVTAVYQITLAWDANTESDLEGYILYRREWSPCPPYDYIDSYPVTESADPLNPMCKVTHLKKDVITILLLPLTIQRETKVIFLTSYLQKDKAYIVQVAEAMELRVVCA